MPQQLEHNCAIGILFKIERHDDVPASSPSSYLEIDL